MSDELVRGRGGIECVLNGAKPIMTRRIVLKMCLQYMKENAVLSGVCGVRL